MHDRRVNGETLVFGNQSFLYMSAMTWFDHKTSSIWSQPWGMAIAGEMKGAALKLIPTSLTPWSTWLAEHPDTRVLVHDVAYPARTSTDMFVIGVTLGGSAAAYPYEVAANERVINDRIGDEAVVVFVDPDTRAIGVFSRVVQDQDDLRFLVDAGGQVTDQQTGSVWDTASGTAVEGPLAGVLLQPLPYVSSFDWAWEDFYPHSRFYLGDASG